MPPAFLNHRILAAKLEFGSRDKVVPYMTSGNLKFIMIVDCFDAPKMIAGPEVGDRRGGRDRLEVILSLLNVIALRFAFDIEADLCLFEDTTLVEFEIQINHNEACGLFVESAICYLAESAFDPGFADIQGAKCSPAFPGLRFDQRSSV